ncbi:MAG: nucleotidyltransferase family protein [Dehalococcoidia bacterium]|jgi:NDP-sugar pyrophosphorylase family protein
MKAIILAAGEGRRLRPLTERVPKPLLPLGGTPLINHLVALLAAHGVTEVAVNLYHRPKAIRDHLGDGSDFGVSITYSHEETLLGSAGAVKKLESFFDESFFVLYGDVLTDIDLTALAAFHRSRGAALTMAVHETDEPERCGIAEADDGGAVRRFREKPAPGETSSRWANAGVYAVEPSVLRFIPPDSFFDFGDHLIPLLLERGEPVLAYPSDSYFLDIGSPERYSQAERDLRAGVVHPSFTSVDHPVLDGDNENAASTSARKDQLRRWRHRHGRVLRAS